MQGSREIAAELDRVSLSRFEATEKRAAIDEAERFGDEELQHPVRQIALWSISRSRASLRSYLEGLRTGRWRPRRRSLGGLTDIVSYLERCQLDCQVTGTLGLSSRPQSTGGRQHIRIAGHLAWCREGV